MKQEEMLKEELLTYEKHLSELVKSDNGKYVLIKSKEIVDTFVTLEDAIKAGYEKFKTEPFLVKKINIITETQNFSSNLLVC